MRGGRDARAAVLGQEVRGQRLQNAKVNRLRLVAKIKTETDFAAISYVRRKTTRRKKRLTSDEDEEDAADGEENTNNEKWAHCSSVLH